MAVTETNIYSRQTSVLPTFKHLNESSNSLQGKFLGLFGTLNILSMIRQEKKIKNTAALKFSYLLMLWLIYSFSTLRTQRKLVLMQVM